jgi:hypothetical protein
MLGTSYLTGRTPVANATEPGQADWADPNAPTTCRQCVQWGDLSRSRKRDHWGSLLPAPCRKARALLPGRRLAPVPHHAKTCRFFEMNPNAPEAMK